MKETFLFSISCIVLLFLASCNDQGDPVSTGPAPILTSVSPDSGKSGDTITVAGTNFGSTQGSSTVLFGSTNTTVIISWNDTQIKAIVPSGLTSGTMSVTVNVGGKVSNTKTFKSLSAITVVHFTEIQSLIGTYSCASCHGGGSTFNNFNITSYNNLMLGNSSHGPVVTVGDGANSVIVKKLLGTAGFGVRMPQNGPPYMSNSEIQKLVDWINQGALNN